MIELVQDRRVRREIKPECLRGPSPEHLDLVVEDPTIMRMLSRTFPKAVACVAVRVYPKRSQLSR